MHIVSKTGKIHRMTNFFFMTEALQFTSQMSPAKEKEPRFREAIEDGWGSLQKKSMAFTADQLSDHADGLVGGRQVESLPKPPGVTGALIRVGIDTAVDADNPIRSNGFRDQNHSDGL